MKIKLINKQRGAALIFGLILLTIASLVAVSGFNAGSMQERMAANQDNSARAFMAAEAGGTNLVEWINENGWPTAANHPQIHRNIGNDGSLITYTLNLQSGSWGGSPLNVLIEGRALSTDGLSVLARTQILVSLDRQPPPPPRSISPPAAVSCFRGACRIIAGSGRGADEGFGTVSGFNHPIPPLTCSGGGCRMQPQGENRAMPAVPAVFFEVMGGSSVGVVGGGGFNAFHGLNRQGDGVVRGNSIAVARGSSHYPNEQGTGVSTAPTWTSVFFGEDVPTTRLESGRTTVASLGGSNVEVGTLVLDGEHLTMHGNALFVGLVIIRNCGTLRMSGNPNIYGAVIVEATRRDGTACSHPYDPFGGAGTPAVRFSRDALMRAAEVGDADDEVDREINLLRWTEFLQ